MITEKKITRRIGTEMISQTLSTTDSFTHRICMQLHVIVVAIENRVD